MTGEVLRRSRKKQKEQKNTMNKQEDSGDSEESNGGLDRYCEEIETCLNQTKTGIDSQLSRTDLGISY